MTTKEKGNEMKFTVVFSGFESGCVAHTSSVFCGDSLVKALEWYDLVFDENHRLYGYSRTIEVHDDKRALIGEVRRRSQVKHGYTNHWFAVKSVKHGKCEFQSIPKILEFLAK